MSLSDSPTRPTPPTPSFLATRMPPTLGHSFFLRYQQRNQNISQACPDPAMRRPTTPSAATNSSSDSPLLSLPPEILLDIIPRLPYPDALALKHTHPRFYNIVDTSVRLKVAWLLDRKVRRLSTIEKKCSLKSDSEFCNGSLAGGREKGKPRIRVQDDRDQVSRIMARRRRHGECEDGRCEVLVGRRCGGRKEDDGLKMELYGLRRWGSRGFRRQWCWAVRVYSLAVTCGFWFLVGVAGILFALDFKSLWRKLCL